MENELPKKEYTFRSIMTYEAETEEQARLILQDDLKHNGNSLFDCISFTRSFFRKIAMIQWICFFIPSN